MRKVFAIASLCLLALDMRAGDLLVDAHYANSVTVTNRRVALKLQQPGAVVAGPWLLAGDFIVQYTDTNGETVFSNVLAGGYSLTIYGSPERSFAFGMPDTNGLVSAAGLIGNTNTTPVYYTAPQVDALIAAGVGSGSGSGVTNSQVLPGIPVSTNGTFAGEFNATTNLNLTAPPGNDSYSSFNATSYDASGVPVVGGFHWDGESETWEFDNNFHVNGNLLFDGTATGNLTGNATTATTATLATTAITATNAITATTANNLSQILTNWFTQNVPDFGGDITNDLFAVSDPTGSPYVFYPMSAPATNFTALGGRFHGPIANVSSQAGFYYPSNEQTGIAGQGIFRAGLTSIKFGTDAPFFISDMSGDGTVLGIIVDGVDVTEDVLTLAGLKHNVQLSYDENFVKVQFTRPARRTVEMRGVGYFKGVFVPKTNAIWRVSPPTRKLLFMGDSFLQFTDGNSTTVLKPISRYVQEGLPDWNVLTYGQTGTGWVANDSAGRTNFYGRLADIIREQPDALLIYGGYNDVGSASSPLQSNPIFDKATNLLMQARAAFPRMPIVVISANWPAALTYPATGTDINVTNLCFLIKSACAAITNVSYFSTIDEPWITGTYNSAGSGNAYQYISGDGIHPTAAGHAFIGKKILAVIRPVLDHSTFTTNSLAAQMATSRILPLTSSGLLTNMANLVIGGNSLGEKRSITFYSPLPGVPSDNSYLINWFGLNSDYLTGIEPNYLWHALPGMKLYDNAGNLRVTLDLSGNTNIFTGGIYSPQFVGGGANLTSLNGTQITSGTVPPAQLGSGSSITTKYLRGDSTWQTISGSGTVTATGGSLTANAVVLGAGTTDTKVSSSITTDGSAKLTLGTLDLGNTTDTTLSRSAAGVVAVEGVDLATGPQLASATNNTILGARYEAKTSSGAVTNGQTTVNFGTVNSTSNNVTGGVTAAGFYGGSGSAGSLSLSNAAGTTRNAFLDGSTGNGTLLGTLDLGNASDTTISRSAAGQISVEGAVVPTVSSTATLTGKTFDAADTGNVLKFKRYLNLKGFDVAVGALPINTNDFTAITYGVPRFLNGTDKAANYIEWRMIVPEDMDTAVDLRARIKFRLTGADTAAHRYVFSFADVANSAAATGSPSTEINLDFAGDASGASGDVEGVTWTTLTGWRSGLTPGDTWVIRIARDGDTSDASTVDSDFITAVIEYGVSQ